MLFIVYNNYLHVLFALLQLEVDFAIGRDIKPEMVNTVVSVLQDW